MSTTPKKNLIGRYGMIVFVILMLAFNLAMFGPPPTDLQFVALSSLGSFAVMTGVAFWLDRQRMASISSGPPSRALSKKRPWRGRRDEAARHSTPSSGGG